MKVMQINTLSRNKSTGRSTYEIHKWLLNHGIESTVICSYLGKYEEQYGQVIIGSKWDMKIHALLSRVFGLQGYFSHRSTKQVINLIKSNTPDIVMLRVLHSNFININKLLIYLKSNNISTVIVLHDLWFMTGHCVYPIATSCSKYTTICDKCNQIHSTLPSWFIDTSKKVQRDRRKIFKDWENIAIVGVSKWVSNCAKKSYVMNSLSKVYTINNWIDQNVFKPYDETKKKDPFVIIGVCVEWSKEKGIESFIELSKLLTNEKLVLVGKMDLKYRKKFEYKDIEFIDFTNSEEELSNLYQNSDVFISFSSQETFGKTTAEAISCGIPAIVYNTTASPELVTNGCGYAIQLYNIEEAYKKILYIKKAGREKYASACKKKAQEDFSLDNNAKKYINIFNELLCNNPE